MALVKFNPSSTAFTNVPNWFISDYMPQASSGHLKVYLYLLMVYQNNSSELSL